MEMRETKDKALKFLKGQQLRKDILFVKTLMLPILIILKGYLEPYL